MTPTEHGSCDKTFLQLHAAFFFPILPTILNYGGATKNWFLLFESSHANVEMLKELQVLNQATGEVNP